MFKIHLSKILLSHSDQIDLNPFSLAFTGKSKDLEGKFKEHFCESSKHQVRIALAIAAILYGLFGILDSQLVPESVHELRIIRFWIVIPAISIIVFLSFTKVYTKLWQPLLSLMMTISGLGIVAMIYFSNGIATTSYYAGLLLIYMVGYSFLRIRFVWSTLAGWIILITYEIIAYNKIPPAIAMNNNFFFISANVIGMVTGYFIELYFRTNYYLLKQLNLEKEKVESHKKELERKVETRTKDIQNANIKLQKQYQEKAILARDLHRNERFLKTIIDNSPQVIFVKEVPSFEYKLFNKSGEKFLGFRKEDVIGKTDFDLYPKEDAKQYKISDINVKEGNIYKDSGYVMTNHKGKKLFTITKIPIFIEGKVNFILGIVEDVTEQKKYEDELSKEKESAEKSDELKTTFLTNMSHELRTPLNTIIGFASLLTDGEVEEEKRKRYAFLLKENSKTLLNLIEDIVDIAKIESGQIRIKKDETYINKIILELFGSFENTIANFTSSEVQLKWSIGNHNPEYFIYTDSYRLRQVLSNLIINALKYTKDGSVEFGYNLYDSEFIQFYVKDTGIGIAKENIDSIFQRFEKVDSLNTKQGAGLGLAICKNLVGLLGGDIWVESEIGKGSNFYFTIPTGITEEEIKEEEIDILPVKKSRKWPEKSILIAEDLQSNYDYLSAILKKTEAKIIWVQNGKEAVETVENNKNIDIVLMDIQMPVMNGYEATHNIKQIRKNLPVIAQTAYAMSDQQDACRVAGCDEFLSKPIRPQSLMNTLDKYLNATKK